MTVTNSQKETAKAIKAWFKALGIPASHCRVQCSPTKGRSHYIHAWIPSEGRLDAQSVGKPTVYLHTFPLFMRQKALQAIYGEDCAFASSGSAGNVNDHSMALGVAAWRKLLGLPPVN